MKIVYITKKKMWNIIRLHKRKLLPGSQQGNAVERQFKVAEWENPDLTSSHRHTAFYSCIWKNSLWKRPENFSFITKDKRATSRQVGEAEICKAKNPSPGVATHISPPSSWGMGGLCPTSSTPNLWACTRELSPWNIWLWKPVGFMSGRPKVLLGSEILLLKGLYTDSLTIGPSAKAAVWKACGL